MSAVSFMRIEKLKGANIIQAAARHNRRTIPVPDQRHDPDRIHLNETLWGPPNADAVASLAKDLMTKAGVGKPRSTAVTCLEVVFSLSVNHSIDERAYFSDCADWAAENFGGVENILSVDIHRDEGAPHCHVLLLPLINGRLNGSEMVGYRTKLLATQLSFHKAVASLYGLSKAPAGLVGSAKRTAAAAVFAKLKSVCDPSLRSVAWTAISDGINANPGPWLLTLGIELAVERRSLKTVAQIFTSKGKGQNSEPYPISKSNANIGFPIGEEETEESSPLCSVGKQKNQFIATPLQAAPARPFAQDSDASSKLASASQRLRDQATTSPKATPSQDGRTYDRTDNVQVLYGRDSNLPCWSKSMAASSGLDGYSPSRACISVSYAADLSLRSSCRPA